MMENMRLAFYGITSHKLRSLLTMLGIIIGIASIIAIVSLVQGTNDQIRRNVVGGSETVVVRLQQAGEEYDLSSGVPKAVPPVSDDVMSELRSIDHVVSAARFAKRRVYSEMGMSDGGVYHGATALSGAVYGIDSDYFSVAGYAVIEGRGITDGDGDSRQHAAVLDETAAQSLFSAQDPVGGTIEINGVAFTVVGVVRATNTFEPVIASEEDYDTYHSSGQTTGIVYVPRTLWPTIYSYDAPENVVLKCDSTESLTQVGRDAADILNTGITGSSSVTYGAENLLEQARQLQEVSSSTSRMLVWIAAISLLVGGIGVMNIMLVSVTERTREIGLEKAIGASNRTIMAQFLTEAVALTSLGGVLGVAAGVILAYAIGRASNTPVSLSVPAMVVAVVFSMVIGIVFGIIPARRAASLDPIVALRRD